MGIVFSLSYFFNFSGQWLTYWRTVNQLTVPYNSSLNGRFMSCALLAWRTFSPKHVLKYYLTTFQNLYFKLTFQIKALKHLANLSNKQQKKKPREGLPLLTYLTTIEVRRSIEYFTCTITFCRNKHSDFFSLFRQMKWNIFTNYSHSLLFHQIFYH